MPKKRRCGFPKCGRPHHAHGWCLVHYWQDRRNGEVKPIHYNRFPPDAKAAVVRAVEHGASYAEAARVHGISQECARICVMKSRAMETLRLRERIKDLEGELARVKARNRVLERRHPRRGSEWFEARAEVQRGERQ